MNTAQQEHFDKYQALAGKLGWADLFALLPISIETIVTWILISMRRRGKDDTRN